MGRYYYSKREEADSLKKIQIWWLKKNNYLETGWCKSGGIKWTNSWTNRETSIGFNVSLLENDQYIQLNYTQTNSTGEKKSFDYKVPLASTPCFFGGKRYWFICIASANSKYCGKRVAVLYKGGDYFACRHCYNLSYQSRNENRRYRDYALFYVLGNRNRMDKLRASMKRSFYNGKPTRKQRALDKLAEREFPYALEFMDIYKKKQLTK